MNEALPYEYRGPMPETVHVCDRCKKGVIHFPGNARPFCPVKGCQTEGQVFVSLEKVAIVLGQDQRDHLAWVLARGQARDTQPFLAPDDLQTFRDEVPAEAKTP